MNYNLRHPIESIRTAPLGFANLGVAGGWMGYQTMEAIEISPNATQAAVHIGSAALLAAWMSMLGGSLVKRQFKRRDYLENSLKEGKFDDKDFGKTVPEWCMRQTARVVAKKHGRLDQYEELCNDNQSAQRLRWLPHI